MSGYLCHNTTKNLMRMHQEYQRSKTAYQLANTKTHLEPHILISSSWPINTREINNSRSTLNVNQNWLRIKNFQMLHVNYYVKTSATYCSCIIKSCRMLEEINQEIKIRLVDKLFSKLNNELIGIVARRPITWVVLL